MTEIFIIGISWILCGLLAAGFLRAYERVTMPYWGKTTKNLTAISSALGFGLFFGPIALVLSFFNTGFWQYGWSLNPGDYLPEDGLAYKKQEESRLNAKSQPR